MRAKSVLFGIVYMAAAIALPQSGRAVPFTLDYDLTRIGGKFQYDFTLRLDNNDGTWAPGQQFDWLNFGNEFVGGGPNGAFGDWTWTSVPTNAATDVTTGGANGPTLSFCPPGPRPYGCDPIFDDGSYVPIAVGEMLTFAGLSSTRLGQGELYWSLLSASAGNSGRFNIANAHEIKPVPLPGALPLFLAAFAGLGLLSRCARLFRPLSRMVSPVQQPVV